MGLVNGDEEIETWLARGALEEVETFVVVEGAELVAVVARGDGGPAPPSTRAQSCPAQSFLLRRSSPLLLSGVRRPPLKARFFPLIYFRCLRLARRPHRPRVTLFRPLPSPSRHRCCSRFIEQSINSPDRSVPAARSSPRSSPRSLLLGTAVVRHLPQAALHQAAEVHARYCLVVASLG
ncbi:hypothetical protein AAHA92_22231 [Salvia divinorum]|uniref:Uncharacterized protein n=1 Tax=Salvia divinorum TaxID=28513 RepID=A0ABD1GR43_SALDI